MRILSRFFGAVFALGTVCLLLGSAVFAFVIHRYSKDLPDHAQLKNYEPPVMTRVHGGDGSLLAEYAKERRLYLPIQAMPKLLINAYLAAEDKNFYEHMGIDPQGIARALMNNFRRGSGGAGREQGASTITQQVAKNFLLTSERSYERKIREALIALRLETAFSKDKILELYLNEIYLGLGNYGVAASALNYFGRSVHELTIAQAAYLAALPKAPNNYHPFNQREAALTRRNYVIDKMIENGYIERKAGEDAKAEALVVQLRSISPDTYAAGFFAEEVRRELAERYGSRRLYEGGLSVRTTLDRNMQLLARRVLVDGLVRYDEAQGYRGPVRKAVVSGDWGAQLAEEKSLNDVDPWRLAVVLDVADNLARIGLQPKREPGGQLSRERKIGTIATATGGRLVRGNIRRTMSVGDVIYAEPITGQDGAYRLRQVPEISGAIVAMDPWTGRVRAMVGGFSFDQSEFNRATQAMRQPGSSFKPFVYATALDNGYTPSSIVLDEAVEIDQGRELGVWRPENYDGRSTGPHTLRYGIENSKNLMTVRLARDIGMPLIAEYSKRFGVYDDMLPVLSMALGAGETTVMRMTAGYSMFANGGRRITPTLIDRVQDRWGNTVFKHEERECSGCQQTEWNGQDEPRLIDRREQVIDPMSAYQITSMMEGVVQRGTATVVKEVGKTLAGKTGTTNDAKDVWFVGFSADLAVGIYLGFDKPKSLGGHVTAGHYVAPIFRDFMKVALAGKPDVKFRVPAQMKLVRVSRGTGMRAGAGDGDAILEAFKPGSGPPETFTYNSDGTIVSGRKPGSGDGEKSLSRGTGGLY